MEVGNTEVPNGTGDRPSNEGVDNEPAIMVDHKEAIETKEDVNSRLLYESKLNRDRMARQKSENAKLKEELEILRRKELEEKQNYKELYERERELRNKADSIAAKAALERQLIPALHAAGCQDDELAMLVGNKELLVNDEGNLEGIEQYIDDLKQKKPLLFGSKTPSSVNTQLPAGGLKVTPKEKDLSRMSAADIRSELASLGKQMAGK